MFVGGFLIRKKKDKPNKNNKTMYFKSLVSFPPPPFLPAWSDV